MDRSTTVLLVIGTRPEAIKLAPVILALRERGIAHEILITGQHHPTVIHDILDWFGIDWLSRNCIGLRRRQTRTLLGGACTILDALQPYIEDDIGARPNLIVVQGDTSSAWAGATAGFLANIPVMHVEAGLRTGDLASPFPEEFNRVQIATATKYHAAPTQSAVQHLGEQCATLQVGSQIRVTGNTIVDATWFTLAKHKGDNNYPARLVTVTMHRRESWGAPLRSICGQLRELVNMHADIQIVLPMHPNPNVRDEIRALNHDRIRLVDPMPYPDFLALLGHSELVLTDSGGVQEETAVMGVPCVVMRETSDRPESIGGNAVLAGTEKVYATATKLLADANELDAMRHAPNPFGDGAASERIADWIGEITCQK